MFKDGEILEAKKPRSRGAAKLRTRGEAGPVVVPAKAWLRMQGRKGARRRWCEEYFSKARRSRRRIHSEEGIFELVKLRRSRALEV